jgi:tripartite-type tricarboxylate transporter receptor subunit TctC
VRADSAFKNLNDVLAEARAKPGSLSFAHAGQRLDVQIMS